MASDVTGTIGTLWEQFEPKAPTGRQASEVLDRICNYGRTDIRDWPPGFRLAARISDLRALGWPITTRTITLPGGARVAEYRL